MKALMAALIASGLAGCATAPAAPAPDITIHAPAEAVRNRLASEMAGRGGQIIRLTDSQLVVDKELDGVGAIASQFLLGNAYSSPPVGTVTFTFLQAPGSVRVLGSAAVTTQMVTGQLKTMQAPANYAGMQRMLADIKTELESGQ